MYAHLYAAQVKCNWNIQVAHANDKWQEHTVTRERFNCNKVNETIPRAKRQPRSEHRIRLLVTYWFRECGWGRQGVARPLRHEVCSYSDELEWHVLVTVNTQNRCASVGWQVHTLHVCVVSMEKFMFSVFITQSVFEHNTILITLPLCGTDVPIVCYIHHKKVRPLSKRIVSSWKLGWSQTNKAHPKINTCTGEPRTSIKPFQLETTQSNRNVAVCSYSLQLYRTILVHRHGPE